MNMPIDEMLNWAELMTGNIAILPSAESMGTLLIALTMLLLCAVSWLGNLVALPGNWGMVLILGIYAWIAPDDQRMGFGPAVVLTALVFALLGELFEFAASALGAKRAGASRKSTLFALIGSFAGAIIGAIVGIPIPIFGPIIAAILFAGLGAMAGAIYGERSNGREWKESWSIGHAAFWGRTLGTFGKISAGIAILVLAILGVVL